MDLCKRMNKADFFISHASEDKETFVRELTNYLMLNGALVFYDEYSIKLGDSLTESINKGISNSSHAILVLSKFFFEKGWTNAELQSLFNKSIREDFKLLIIYHGVNHSDVAQRYPLLADIKGINSSVGKERISEELFNAIGKNQELAYITTHEIKFTKERIKEGFSTSMYVGFPNFHNQSFEKVLFEMGHKDQFHTRLRIIYQRNRICFEVIDSDYKKFSISADISNWREGDQYFVHANLSLTENKIFLFIEDRIVAEMNFMELNLREEYFNNSAGIVGNSLELTNPCQFVISTLGIGKSIDNTDDLVSFSISAKKLINESKK